jgi:hypothetical protein
MRKYTMLSTELSRLRTDHFVALILDNEVTVGEFVVDPPLTWIRFVQQAGVFRMADGYPNVLTMAQAKFEMRNWDEVSSPSIMRGLAELNDGVDYVLFGNNAGQGLPLAKSLAPRLIAKNAAIIYANSLPEKAAYEQLGYRTFFRRSDAVSRLIRLANDSTRTLSLCFINTIQHNDGNYHDP